MTSAMWELMEIKVAEFVKEHGLGDNIKEQVLEKFGEDGLACLLTNYKV